MVGPLESGKPMDGIHGAQNSTGPTSPKNLDQTPTLGKVEKKSFSPPEKTSPNFNANQALALAKIINKHVGH